MCKFWEEREGRLGHPPFFDSNRKNPLKQRCLSGAPDLGDVLWQRPFPAPSGGTILCEHSNRFGWRKAVGFTRQLLWSRALRSPPILIAANPPHRAHLVFLVARRVHKRVCGLARAGR